MELSKRSRSHMLLACMAFICIQGCIEHGSDLEPKTNEQKTEADILLDYFYENDQAARKALINEDFGSCEKYNLLMNNETKRRKLDESFYNARNYEQLARFVYVPQGRFRDAENAEIIFYKLFKSKMAHHEEFWHYGYLAKIYTDMGKFDDARKAVDWLITNAERSGAEGTKYTNAYPNIAYYYNAVADTEKSVKMLEELLAYCNRVQTMPQNMAKAKNYLGMAYYYSGKYQSAENMFKDAANTNMNAVVGYPEDLAISMTLRARIAEHKSEYDFAIKTYNSIILMLEHQKTKSFPGAYRVEQADAWHQLAKLQLRLGKLDEATRCFSEAMALREATATQTHPNYADSIRGMAGATLVKGNMTSATLQAEESLKILDTALVPTHPRISPTLIALSSIYELTGKPEKAAPLNARIETILQKPLGPWKEDFMETAAFYAEILKKNGKTAAAAHLEELQARQKDKR